MPWRVTIRGGFEVFYVQPVNSRIPTAAGHKVPPHMDRLAKSKIGMYKTNIAHEGIFTSWKNIKVI